MKETVTQISGLELYWRKVKKMDDFMALSSFRECLGNPARGTFYQLLKYPGKMKTSHAIALARYLSGITGEKIQPEDFLKHY